MIFENELIKKTHLKEKPKKKTHEKIYPRNLKVYAKKDPPHYCM